MTTIGLDLHKRESQLCIAGDEGAIQEPRIVTSRDRFTAVLGGLDPARILLEASTESEWVARHLESHGHEVSWPTVALLMTVPGIGVITASTVVAVADDITRFDSAHRFEAFLGLVPG